jgi:predicted metal-dependent hydrolase
MEEETRMTESEELTKEELERRKLLLEIAELKKEWWKKPTYIAALFPTLLALITLAYGFANGYFQASFTKLENQKYDLQKEIKVFQEQKEQSSKELEKINNEIIKQQEELSKTIEELKKTLINTSTNPNLIDLKKGTKPIERK